MQRKKENPYREKIRYSLQSYEAHLHPAHLKLLAQLLRSQRLALLGPQQLPIELHSRTHARWTTVRVTRLRLYTKAEQQASAVTGSVDRQTDSGAHSPAPTGRSFHSADGCTHRPCRHTACWRKRSLPHACAASTRRRVAAPARAQPYSHENHPSRSRARADQPSCVNKQTSCAAHSANPTAVRAAWPMPSQRCR